MKINFFRPFFAILLFSLVTVSAFAERGSPSVAPARPSSGSPVNFRLLANYDFIMTSPSGLNDQRAQPPLWNSTTATQGSFNNMNGYTLGGGYFMGKGFLSVEYSHAIQELPNTLIAPGTYSVQDTLNYDAVYVLYDWVFNKSGNQSYELGLGLGQAIKFQYHNILTSGGVTEDLFWQATPMVFKARAHYSYHFSNHVRLRLGATYENATSSSMKADSNHPTVTIGGSSVVSGQTLKSPGGTDTKVDISGFRLNAGLVVAF